MTEPSASPSVGDVWLYPYLWHREARNGETEGRKDRRCALALVEKTENGSTLVYLVPITSVPPSSAQPFTVEVPEIEKRRAGLDAHLPLWVIADEFNEDVPGQSFYFEPGNRVGSFSSAFIKRIQSLMIQAIKAQKHRKVSRR